MKKKKMEYTALGFPVILLGFQMKKVRGVEVPDVNLNKLQQLAFEALISKPVTLSGAEVRFIRSYLRLDNRSADFFQRFAWQDKSKRASVIFGSAEKRSQKVGLSKHLKQLIFDFSYLSDFRLSTYKYSGVPNEIFRTFNKIIELRDQ